MAYIQGMSERLEEAIEKSGKTITEISKAANVTRPAIYNILNYESGGTALTVARLCAALNISADWLLGLKGVMYDRRTDC